MLPRLLTAFVLSFAFGMLALWAPPALDAGWGGGNCAAVAAKDPDAFKAIDAGNGYEWRRYPAIPGQDLLFKHGVQVGGWNRIAREYRSYEAATGWGEPTAPPWAESIPAPRKHHGGDCVDGCDCGPHCDEGCECRSGKVCSDACRCVVQQKAEVDLLKNPGVDQSKMHEHVEESIRLNGQPISRAAAKKLLEAEAPGGKLPDDGKLLRLTVIGSEPERNQVLADVDAFHMRDQLVIQAYPADHWAVARAGFKTDGHPTLYLQAPDGKVLHRSDVYAGGEMTFGPTGAVRKAQKDYDAKKDPNLNAPAPVALPPAAIGTAALCGALLALGHILRRSP